ncbi:MAG: hypothetical protein CMJ19_18875 [Phycisphaeraceae bacterium]|nr:hypothetical protein [Phycisphaeraceae bacterium]
MRWCLLLVLSLLMTLPSMAAELSSTDAALLHQAQQAINNQQASAAIAPLTQLLQSHPDLGQAHRLLGHAYAMTGQTDLARQHLITAISHGQMTTDALARLYQLDRANELHLANHGQLMLLSVLEPNDKQYPMLLAQTHETLGNTQAAQTIYHSQLNRQPANDSLLVKLGQLAIGNDDTDQALVYLQTAEALGQTPVSAEQTISRLYAQNRQFSEALLWHLKAWPNLNTAPASEQIQRVTLLKESGDLEAASDLAKIMVVKNIAADQALLMLARIAMQMNDHKQVRLCFEKLTAIGQAPARITAYLGALAFNELDYQQASHYLAISDADEPLNREQLQSLIISYLKTDRLLEARQAMEVYLVRFDLDQKLQQALKQWAQKNNPPSRDTMD